MDAPKSVGEEIGTVVYITPSGPARQTLSTGKKMAFLTGKRPDNENVTITVQQKNPADRLQNGDGFSFIAKGSGEIVGFRGDVCQGNRITCRNVPGLHPGAKLYRNHSSAFEKELNSDLPVRRISVSVDISVIVVPVTTTGSVTEWCRSVTENIGPVTDDSCPATEKGRSPSQSKRLSKQTYSLKINAVSQDGRSIVLEREAGDSTAENAKRMREMFVAQISKDTGIYSFTLSSLNVETPDGSLPFLPASALNAIRRDLAAALDKMPCRAIPLPTGKTADNPGIYNALNTPNNAESPSECQDRRQDQKPILSKIPDIQEPASDGIHVSYKANIANHVARETYQVLGATQTDEAFEISHLPGTELMRTKYCIRHELGLCPVHRETGRHQGKANFATGSSKLATTTPSGHLYLINNGKRYHLSFDCANCEMVVRVND